MNILSKIKFKWTTLQSIHGDNLAAFFSFLLSLRLFFAYKNILPVWILLISDVVVSILAIVFAFDQIRYLKDSDTFVYWCAVITIILPFLSCLYGLIMGSDFAGVSEYLGLYSAYLGISVCFYQASRNKK